MTETCLSGNSPRMGFLSTLFSRRRSTKAGTVGESRRPWAWRTHSSIIVDEDRALAYAAVWACVRIISETIAAMPWPVLEKTPGGGREILHDHAVFGLLNKKANLETTAFEFKQTLVAHTLTWGNGYAEIDRAPNSEIRNLWQLPPDRVEPKRRDDGSLVYEVRPAGTGDVVVLPSDRVLHFRGLGFDGIKGYSVIQMAAQSIGLGLATERFGNDFFGNGAHPSGVVTTPKGLSDKAIENLRASLNMAVGPGEWLSPLFLEEGMSWTTIGVEPEAAQFLESRKFQTTEIARWFRVPPHKLADLERATFSNIEQQAIEFVTDTIMPWAVRFEQEVDAKLLPRQPKVFSKINLNGLLRGDIKSRYDAYAVGRNWGWLSVNDVRGLEDLNPIKGGDDYMSPLNMTLLEKIGQDQPAPAPGGGDTENGKGNNRMALTWKD